MIILTLCLIFGWLLIGFLIFTILTCTKTFDKNYFTTKELVILYLKFTLLGPLSLYIVYIMYYLERVLFGDVPDKDD